ncbi:Dihydroneopterin aldolase [Saliniradius amylolyticus]|uniref:7,8-dihydroneopterin aldolase n=1 Tax=Saliniradius amylolyticus TaxID=2183582 RepID=A0A2S2E253_9ALTE|nr:dihydroneopterin aldolase [Saliniradius amylolyticus]AWL11097.1 Dihydroneopterin aldolase [Saliniradius amylolyticus]
MDTIYIEKLGVESLIGVYDWERHSPTSLLLDVTLGVDLQPATLSDDVTDTVDYARVAETLEEVAAQSQFELLEALAGKMIERLFNDFVTIQRVRLKVSKPGILPLAENVAIEMQRERP